MSCNCGCHNDRPPATGWRRYVPFVVAAVVVATLIAGAVLKNDKKKEPTAPSARQAATASP